MTNLRRSTLSIVLVFFLATACVAQGLTWYRFDQDFISSNYSDSAIGDLSTKQFHPAKTVHSISCGGNDGELHIGMTLKEVQLPSGQMPLTNAPRGNDPNWGLVAELPNAKLGNGPNLLTQLAGQAITFHGYFRVWDEGHGVGQVFPSNPHHVFEVHPAWGFDGNSVHFMQEDLVKTIPKYSGYGGNKLTSLLKAISNGTWPRAYQDSQTLRVGLAKDNNFYQLSVEIKNITNVSGGHEVAVDVFSNKAMTKVIYSGLKAITVTGSSVDQALTVGQQTSLLGFFSVNLKKALEASAGATSKSKAVSVKDAVEFFVFGPAAKNPVPSCGKKKKKQG